MVKSTLIVMINGVLISLCIFASRVTATTAEEWYEQGCRFFGSDDCENAVECFDHAIGLNPQFTDAYLNRGLAFWYLRHDERAIEDFDKVIELNPCSDLACRALKCTLSELKPENGYAAKAATPTLTPALTIIPTVPPSEATSKPVEKEKEAEYPIPGFEPKFALAGLLAIAYFILNFRRRSHNDFSSE